MARYTGPVCRLCRRDGVKLYIKGTRCDSILCPIEKKKGIPGVSLKKKKTSSEYGIQLREKQKVKRHYGILENQFKNCYQKATRLEGAAGANLLFLLERRLDNVVYRLGFGSSRSSARQLVRHNNVLVNGKKVNIPSYQISVGDEVKVVPHMKENVFLQESITKINSAGVKKWLSVDAESMTGKVEGLPVREDIDIEINENLIVELYSR